MTPDTGETKHTAIDDYELCERAFLTSIRARQGAAGKSEIVHDVDCHPETAQSALDRLVENGALHTRKIGQHHVFWLTGAEQAVADRTFDTGDTRDFPDHKFLQAVQDNGGIAGASEVATAVECTRRNAFRRLNMLADDGLLIARSIQPSRIWWFPELAPHDTADQATLEEFDS